MNVIAPLSTNKETVTYSRASIASTRNRGGNFVIVGANELRFNHYLDSVNPYIDYFSGVLIEPKRTNYLRNTASSLVPGLGSPTMLTSQTVTLTITPDTLHLTLSFFGSGTVSVQGGGFTYTLVGTSDYSSTSPSYITFPTMASTLSIDVSGSVYAANLEGAGSGLGSETNTDILTEMTRPTSWIPTTSSVSTREADLVSTSGILFNEFTEDTLEFDPLFTYIIGGRCKYENKIWQSTVEDNLGNLPSDVSVSWSKVQTVNNFALLDLEENSNSIAIQGTEGTHFVYIAKPDSPTYTPASLPRTVNAFFTDACAVEIQSKVSEVSISVSTSAGVFSKTVVTKDYSSANLVSGLYKEIEKCLSKYVTFRVYNVTVSLRLHNGMDSTGEMLDPLSTVKIGEIVFGNSLNFGGTAYGMRSGIIDYSRKETNDFGVTSFIKRSFSKTVNCSVYVKNEDYNRVVRTFQELMSKPTVWIATESQDYVNGSIIYGTYKDFTVVISYPSYSMLETEIQGLVI